MRRTHTLGPPAVLLCLTTLLCAVPDEGSAQESQTLQPGTRIRFTTTATPSEWRVGTLLGRTADSMRIELRAPGGAASFPVQTITNLEVSRGAHSNTGKGARIGAIAGAGAGLLFIPAAVDECENSCGVRVPAAIALLSGVLGGVGAGIGALIGSTQRSERWEPVRSWQLGVHGTSDRIGIRITLRAEFLSR